MRREERMVTDEREIQAVLDNCKVCRLGLSDQGSVYIVPMNYGYCHEDGGLVIYFHGANEGRKLQVIRENPKVGIEMDCGHELVEGRLACQYSYHYASIIGTGTASVIEDQQEKLRALGIIMKHQTGREFEEFETNPKLEKIVSIIKVVMDVYTCKRYF